MPCPRLKLGLTSWHRWLTSPPAMGAPPPVGAILFMYRGCKRMWPNYQRLTLVRLCIIWQCFITCWQIIMFICFVSVDYILANIVARTCFAFVGGVKLTFARYFVLGSALSFLTGRTPGSLPENVIAEMSLPFVVLALWVMSYSQDLNWGWRNHQVETTYCKLGDVLSSMVSVYAKTARCTGRHGRGQGEDQVQSE